MDYIMRYVFSISLGYTLLEFITVIIIILMHGIAHYSIHSGGPYMDFSFFSQSTCYFYAVLHIWTIYDIMIFKLG